MENFEDFWDGVVHVVGNVLDIFTAPIFRLGSTDFSVGTILYVIVAFILLFYITRKIRQALVGRILSRTSMDPGSAESAGTIARFLIIFIGSIIIVQSAGINMSTLSILAGALGVGIGFGLQSITDNFISGIIILFEKPIKVGDRIEVGSIEGDVTSISVRSTTVLTNDNISVIVPNSEFISQRVINWSHNDRNVRYRIPVGVSYNEDPKQIKAILLKVAEESPHVLKEPAPMVLFEAFGDSSLNFELAIWTATHSNRPRILKSELYFEIFDQFKQQGVEIPFPQRDLHIRSSAVPSVS
ncbi:MAG: mechanosensitive ion channel domain-containing protein [Bacteroidota bacterium]